MKLQLMFLLMDIFMSLVCGYLWLKYAFVRVLRGRSKIIKS